jgi:anti-sigma B factor antagonist
MDALGGSLSALIVNEDIDEPGSVVLALEGELDLETEEALTALLVGAFETGATTVVLDMSAVTFVDSSGLTSLVTALTSAREAGAGLVLRKTSRQLRDLLAVTSLDGVFVVES